MSKKSIIITILISILLIGAVAVGVLFAPDIREIFDDSPESNPLIYDKDEDGSDESEEEVEPSSFTWYEDEYIKFQHPIGTDASFNRERVADEHLGEEWDGGAAYIEELEIKRDGELLLSINNMLTLYGIGGHGYTYDPADPYKLEFATAPEETIYSLIKKPVIKSNGSLQYMYLDESYFEKKAVVHSFDGEIDLPEEESYMESLLLIKLESYDNGKFVSSPIVSVENSDLKLDFLTLNREINNGATDWYYILYDESPTSQTEAEFVVHTLRILLDSVERKKW